MSFKVIETQEEFDEVVKERLKREQEKYADYDQLKSRNSELETEVGGLKATINESDEKIKRLDAEIGSSKIKITGFETASMKTKIALQNGLPIDFADRLVGEDEASLKADAERMASFIKTKPVPPLKTTEPIIDDKDSGLKNMLKNMSNEGE